MLDIVSNESLEEKLVELVVGWLPWFFLSSLKRSWWQSMGMEGHGDFNEIIDNSLRTFQGYFWAGQGTAEFR